MLGLPVEVSESRYATIAFVSTSGASYVTTALMRAAGYATLNGIATGRNSYLV
jgi:hypothetical protein